MIFASIKSVNAYPHSKELFAQISKSILKLYGWVICRYRCSLNPKVTKWSMKINTKKQTLATTKDEVFQLLSFNLFLDTKSMFFVRSIEKLFLYIYVSK